MNKSLIRLFCLTTAVISMVSFTGCKANPASNTEKKTTKTTQEITPFMKYDPPITMTTANSVDQSGEGGKYIPGEDAENNVIYKMWEDVIGIKIKNKITTSPSAFKDKMQMAIAGNDIPDFETVDQTMLSSMIKGGMVEDLTEVYNKYASDNLKAVLGQSNNALFAPAMKNGKIMALPAPTTIYDFSPILWIRKDWMEKLKLEEPKTMDDVLEMAKAFTTKDPDENGKDDTLGLFMDKDLNGLNFIMNAYGAYTSPFSNGTSSYMMWLKNEKGDYYNGVTDPKVKTVLEKISELYKMGAIDKEFAVKDFAKEAELIAAGKIGIYIGYFYSPLSPLQDSRKDNPNADWVPVKMPAAKGVDKYVPGVPLNAYGYVYLRKGYENPEALIIMMNHLVEGYGATWLHKGEPTEFEKRYNEIANDPKYKGKSINNWMPIQVAGNINWGSLFKKAYDAKEKQLPGKQADYDRMLQEDPMQAWGWKKTYLEGYMKADHDTLKYSDYNGAPTDTMVKTKSLLDKEILTSFVAYIMGTKPIDDFDNFVKRYNELGASKAAEEIKEALK